MLAIIIIIIIIVVFNFISDEENEARVSELTCLWYYSH